MPHSQKCQLLVRRAKLLVSLVKSLKLLGICLEIVLFSILRRFRNDIFWLVFFVGHNADGCQLSNAGKTR